jgi:hypothetical protein
MDLLTAPRATVPGVAHGSSIHPELRTDDLRIATVSPYEECLDLGKLVRGAQFTRHRAVPLPTLSHPVVGVALVGASVQMSGVHAGPIRDAVVADDSAFWDRTVESSVRALCAGMRFPSTLARPYP